MSWMVIALVCGGARSGRREIAQTQEASLGPAPLARWLSGDHASNNDWRPAPDQRSGRCGSFRGRPGPFLGTVTRLQVADVGQPQRPERPGSVGGDRFGGQADVVAALVEQRDAPYGQPMGALPEHRSATGPGIDGKAGELVDGIAG